MPYAPSLINWVEFDTFACNKDEGRNFTESYAFLIIYLHMCAGCVSLFVVLPEYKKQEESKCSTVNITLINSQYSRLAGITRVTLFI